MMFEGFSDDTLDVFRSSYTFDSGLLLPGENPGLGVKYDEEKTGYGWKTEAYIDAGNIIALDTPDKLIDNLIAEGFERPKEMKLANLEDVFIHLTGHSLREG